MKAQYQTAALPQRIQQKKIRQTKKPKKSIPLRLERLSTGTKETGYYLKMEELLLGDASVLKKGVTYRFEYIIRGSGQWGIKTDQTGWYPCVPMSDQFGMGIVTYQAGSAASCNLMLYAVDRTNGMYLEVDSIKIYEVR